MNNKKMRFRIRMQWRRRTTCFIYIFYLFLCGECAGGGGTLCFSTSKWGGVGSLHAATWWEELQVLCFKPIGTCHEKVNRELRWSRKEGWSYRIQRMSNFWEDWTHSFLVWTAHSEKEGWSQQWRIDPLPIECGYGIHILSSAVLMMQFLGL